MYDKKKIFTPLFCICFWIRDPGWVKIILEAVNVNVEQVPLILKFFKKQYASCVFCLALRTVSLPTFTS
jgi:hypothetical protein